MALTRSQLFPVELVLFIFCSLFANSYPRMARFVFMIPVVAFYIFYVTQLPKENAKTADYAAALLGITFVVKAFAFFVASDPSKEDWMVTIKKTEDGARNGRAIESHNSQIVQGGVVESGKPMYWSLTPWEKLKWVAGNSCSSRGLGWNWQIKYIPEGVPPGTPAFSYILQQFVHLTWCYILQDIGRTYLYNVDYVQTDGRDGIPVKNLNGYKRFEIVMMLGLRTFVETGIPYVLLCVLGVATGLFWSVPENNAPVFGVWSETWTIRRFWGRTWHQHIRRPMQTIGVWFARDILRASKGTLVSRYTQVYVSFFFSALIHVVGALTLDPNRSYYYTWKFFLFQGHGIMVEDFAIYLGKKLGVQESRWTHLLGLAWTVVWFTWTSPWFFDDCTELGVVRPEMFPVSVIRGVWKGKWAVATV